MLNNQFKKPEDSPGFLLWQVSMKWQRKLSELLKNLDLTHAQFILLASSCFLQISKKKVTQVKLAKFTQIDPMTTSQVLRTLEKKQLITRAKDPEDSRALIIKATEKGKKLAKKSIPIIEKADRDFFSKIKQSSELLKSLKNLALKY
ncbi:Uncharacterized HTH-type transcriptional regulator YdcH [Chlamydiales bacterium SCGC AB-751-O23]|jgi:MarR family transcriptional regulator, organic hydroperoxide resistance regulator|nr:Uncharacterized HTH-type transcriptional regulator YdcH [Chlamydiales bacterium SCGC AB-751-O23]